MLHQLAGLPVDFERGHNNGCASVQTLFLWQQHKHQHETRAANAENRAAISATELQKVQLAHRVVNYRVFRAICSFLPFPMSCQMPSSPSFPSHEGSLLS